MTSAARPLTSAPQLRLLRTPMTEHDRRETPTDAAPPPEDVETNPQASSAPLASPEERRPAIAPPPRTPDEAELGSSGLASRRPPAWWADSYVGQALSNFSAEARRVAEDAREMREARAERERFEASQQKMQEDILAAVQRADQNGQANYAMLRSELLQLKDSDRQQNARLAEGDQRFSAIEQSIANLKDELIQLITLATADAAKRLEALEEELAAAKASRDPAQRP